MISGQIIDFRSDTVTPCSSAMREVMFKARIDDDTYFSDQTTLDMEQKFASLFGKQAALLIPTTTMGNLISVKLWTKPGEQVIIWANSHAIDRQMAGIAMIGGVQTLQLYGDTGTFHPNLIKSKIKKQSKLGMIPPTKLIFIENATFRGDVWPLDDLKQIKKIADQNGLKVHIDGARIFNAIASYNCDPKQIGECFDSMILCFTKGLSCPVGSVLISSSEAIKQARSIRKGLGGGLKQTGFISASAIYALEHIVPEIKEDNEVAKKLGINLSEFSDIEIDVQKIKINMVHFSFKNPQTNHELFHKFMGDHNIKIKPVNKDTGNYRLVVHRSIREPQVQAFISAIKEFLKL